jgi:hypothetical protein
MAGKAQSTLREIGVLEMRGSGAEQGWEWRHPV